MCDTVVALSRATADGSVLFGKNSDREPDEVQNVEVIPGGSHGPGETVECTYLTIPQVPRTATVLLCRPFWMFGAEMGANEHGVVIGNEALFTREKPERRGLTGMDLLRLALERSRSAAEARAVIIDLLEEYGQGGNCGYRLKAHYMNGFLIADSREAYILETVKSWWAWKRVEDFGSISNVISLTNNFDACSPGLIENAVHKGWAKNEEDFDFRRCYSDRLITAGARGRERERCSRALLAEKRGKLTLAALLEILRDHGGAPGWQPDRPASWGLCMHAKDPLFGRSQTTGSLAARLSPAGNTFLVTGAPCPCLTPFFPVFSRGKSLPAEYVPGGGEEDNDSYWWECERRHRRARKSFLGAQELVPPRLRALEAQMLAEIEKNGGELPPEAVDRWFGRLKLLGRELSAELEQLPTEKRRCLYRLYWCWYDRPKSRRPARLSN